MAIVANAIVIVVLMKCKCLLALVPPSTVELIATALCSVCVICVGFTHGPYLARTIGIDPTEAYTCVPYSSCSEGTAMLLSLDAIVTATHLVLPVRWSRLILLEVVVVGTYGILIFTVDSPKLLFTTLVMLTFLVTLSSFGRRSLESRDRVSFLVLAMEKQRRFQLEHLLAKSNLVPLGEDAPLSVTGSSGTNEMFSKFLDCSNAVTERLVKIAELGLNEHWLLDATDVQFPQQSEILGAGSFGLVVPAIFHGLVVAVKSPHTFSKSLPIANLGSIAHELRILRRLRHPNIVLLYGALVDPKSSEIALVMEYVEGMQLDEYVALSLMPEVRHGLLTDICCALRYLHAQRPPVVHGDLKGANIRVEHASATGGVSTTGSTAVRAKLLDFGLSRLVTKDSPPLGGSVKWIAPELLMARRGPPESSADIFSFGRLLYLVMTGERPLDGVTPQTIIKHARKHGRVPPLPWPAACPFRDQSIALCNELLHFQPLRRPDIVTVSAELLTWWPIGLAVAPILAASDGGFEAALQHARAQLLMHWQDAQRCPVAIDNCSKGGDTAGGDAVAAAPAADAAAAVAAAAAGPAASGTGDAAAGTGSGGKGAGIGSLAGAGDVGTLTTAANVGTLLQPFFSETPDSTKMTVLLDAFYTWNCRVPSSGTTCCSFHALVACEMPKLQTLLTELNCDTAFTSYQGWQCPDCKLMDCMPSGESALTCTLCGYYTKLADHVRAVEEGIYARDGDDSDDSRGVML
eukprot:NODE_1436_length_2477_cov_13.977447.p1 GENE.NODE_1436_length_2477_cov_13.977447~~NODE_1436_length_2477_cov_13.977447.p1  ORF type:complete len:760 (+),score=133.64 NODE_1436_length_2477_cov_13.977447:41-2281(+)